MCCQKQNSIFSKFTLFCNWGYFLMRGYIHLHNRYRCKHRLKCRIVWIWAFPCMVLINTGFEVLDIQSTFLFLWRRKVERHRMVEGSNYITESRLETPLAPNMGFKPASRYSDWFWRSREKQGNDRDFVVQPNYLFIFAVNYAIKAIFCSYSLDVFWYCV